MAAEGWDSGVETYRETGGEEEGDEKGEKRTLDRAAE
jgi:hypothetical protein